MPPQSDNTRNTVIFVVAALAMLLIYQVFVMAPAQKRAEAERAKEVVATAPGTLPATPAGPTFVSRDEALAATPRIPIRTPALSGSISLKGGKIDDLYLLKHTTEPKSDQPVELLRPDGAQYAYFTFLGWAGQNIADLPDANTVWTVTSGSTLEPGSPVELIHRTSQGLVFQRRISVDDQYMFTITDWVTNNGEAPLSLAPYGTVQRKGLEGLVARGVHEGRISVLGEPDDRTLKVRKYGKWAKDAPTTINSTGGWLGITDKYWLAAVIPDQKRNLSATFRVETIGGVDVYESAYLGEALTLQPGAQHVEQTRVFAGAKRVPILRDYEKSLGIPRLEDAVDWTNIYFITKPIFWLLNLFYGWVGNFGLAILMMTVVVKLAFFYPANLSFESMTKMKKVQPKLEALKAQYKDNPAGLQQAMMKMYRDEKINPLLGCLPMLATIPVFLGLFYVLNVTIEMRHAPFIGWIADLSARDPSTIWNLFGLIPWDPAKAPLIGPLLNGALHLGVWPLLYGLTMWLTQSMSPPAGDPMQQKILMWMPVIFTFVLAQFAAGLLIYYVWSNLLTILQQYVIMRRFKVDNPIDKAIRKVTGKPAPTG